MIFDRLDHWISLLGRIPRSPADVREAVERLIAPGLAAERDYYEASRDRCVIERDGLRARLDVETALRRSDDAYRAMAAACAEAERQRDDLRAAMVGALRELDAIEPADMWEAGLMRIAPARGLLRGALGDAPTEPTGCVRGAPSRECNCSWCCAHMRGKS